MSANTVYVKNISSQTSEKEIREFFSFCGKISNLEVKSAGSNQEATVTFEKETAAKTALLLDATRLGANEVKVESASSHTSETEDHTHNATRDSDEITQEEKPRSRIIAEYLAHGYVIKDAGIQRAIDLDNKHGVSNRFLTTLQGLDQKYHATDKAKSVDQSYGVTKTANNWLSGLTSYYEAAVGTPTGQKLVNFYTNSQRQVIDIHNEAQRLANLKKDHAGGAEKAAQKEMNAAGMEKVTETGKTTCKCGSDSGACPCAPGSCACKNCAKSEVKTVPGTDKTTCSCGGNMSDCPCKEGHCACSSCPKATIHDVGGNKTKCSCGGAEGNCACAPGQCACSNCAK